MDNDRKLWEKAADFHGHICGGLTIGYKASLYAIELLNIQFSDDEQVVCIAENDACGVDAVQAILGCSVGKGNLLFHLTGKQAFNFYERKTGRSVRLMLKQPKHELQRAEMLDYYQSLKPSEMFTVKETVITLPERAMIFSSTPCTSCGESVAEAYIRLQEGKPYCSDCCPPYNRFHI